MRLTAFRSALLAAFALGAHSYSHASGFQLLEQNASGLGNAYAGSAAVAEDASTVFFNPAGMTKLQPREISVGVNLLKPSFKFTDNGSSVAPAATGSNGGDAGGIAAVPNAYMSWAIAPELYAGVGIGAPFGLKTEFDADWVGRFQSIEFDVKTINVNPSLAWKINPRVSVGAGLNWQRMQAKYVRMAAVVNAATQSTQVTLDAEGDSWGWNAGVLWDVTDTTRLGASYRSAVKHTLEGTLTSTNQLVSPDTAAHADLTLPDSVIVSATHQVTPQWQILADVSWTGWSKLDEIDIMRANGTTAQVLEAKFKDTWRVALGATQQIDSNWKLKYGIAYDQAPVRSAQTRLTSLPDHDRTWVSFGTQYSMDKARRIDLGATYIFIKDPEIDNNQATSGRGRVTGSFKGSVAILGLQYSQAF